jgi:hypothetical protein
MLSLHVLSILSLHLPSISCHSIFSLYAVTPCSLYTLSLHLPSISCHSMFSLYAVTSCSHYMLSLHLLSICCHSMISLHAIHQCSLNMLSLHTLLLHVFTTCYVSCQLSALFIQSLIWLLPDFVSSLFTEGSGIKGFRLKPSNPWSFAVHNSTKT